FYVLFFNAPAISEIYTLSLHDALPICVRCQREDEVVRLSSAQGLCLHGGFRVRIGVAEDFDDIEALLLPAPQEIIARRLIEVERSEEHTSNSSHQIISYAVFCLKKKIE